MNCGCHEGNAAAGLLLYSIDIMAQIAVFVKSQYQQILYGPARHPGRSWSRPQTIPQPPHRALEVLRAGLPHWQRCSGRRTTEIASRLSHSAQRAPPLHRVGTRLLPEPGLRHMDSEAIPSAHTRGDPWHRRRMKSTHVPGWCQHPVHGIPTGHLYH